MIVPPSDPAHPAHHGFTTTQLFASAGLDDAAALDRALEQFLALCDEQRLRRPILQRGIPATVPCWLAVTVREHRTTHAQVGRLQLKGADGGSSFAQHWQVGHRSAPVEIEPARQPLVPAGTIGVSLVVPTHIETPRFVITIMNPEIGGGGEVIIGTKPNEKGFTEARLRTFLAVEYGMSQADIGNVVQAAKDRVAPQMREPADRPARAVVIARR